MNYFDGKKIRDEILEELRSEIKKKKRKPGLAAISIGENSVSDHYVSLKKKFADRIGANFYDFNYDSRNTQEEIIAKITELNSNENIDGIMIQMPVPDKFNKLALVYSINPKKDVDGLRFCCGYDSDYRPPVVLAILEALKRSDKLSDQSKIVVVGHGFLVGEPLTRVLKERNLNFSIGDSHTENLSELTSQADIIISAVGQAEVIRPKMIKNGVVLIDAGTTEVSGELRGDIESECYKKASYYTPVPGGIGPMTVAMLFKNLVK